MIRHQLKEASNLGPLPLPALPGSLESPVGPVTWVERLGDGLLIVGAILAVHEPRPGGTPPLETGVGIVLPR